MKKLFLSISFIVMFSVLSFGTENNFTENHTNFSKALSLNNTFTSSCNIVIDEYDICTVTVTVTLSNGNSYSATASNNQGDCFAARDAAYEHAMLLARVFGGIQ
jgi:hypothetical protein